MQIQLYRCVVCGIGFLEEESSTCPFCGASKKYVVCATDKEFTLQVENISQKSLENIDKAIALEIDNTEFYFCAETRATLPYAKTLFGGLARVEFEHAKLLHKTKNAPTAPVLNRDNLGKCTGDFKKDLENAFMREQTAIASYARFADEAVEPRIKQLFKILVEIEQSHLQIENEHLQRLK